MNQKAIAPPVLYEYLDKTAQLVLQDECLLSLRARMQILIMLEDLML